jgi:hypothetical protein
MSRFSTSPIIVTAFVACANMIAVAIRAFCLGGEEEDIIGIMVAKEMTDKMRTPTCKISIKRI